MGDPLPPGRRQSQTVGTGSVRLLPTNATPRDLAAARQYSVFSCHIWLVAKAGFQTLGPLDWDGDHKYWGQTAEARPRLPRRRVEIS
jgi:hypothetical protein